MVVSAAETAQAALCVIIINFSNSKCNRFRHWNLSLCILRVVCKMLLFCPKTHRAQLHLYVTSSYFPIFPHTILPRTFSVTSPYFATSLVYIYFPNGLPIGSVSSSAYTGFLTILLQLYIQITLNCIVAHCVNLHNNLTMFKTAVMINKLALNVSKRKVIFVKKKIYDNLVTNWVLLCKILLIHQHCAYYSVGTFVGQALNLDQ